MKLRAVISNYFLGNVLTGMLAMVAIPFYTHLLPPQQYGQYSLFLVTVNLATTFLYGWMSQISIRFYHEYARDFSLGTYYSNIVFIWQRLTLAILSLVSILTVMVLLILGPTQVKFLILGAILLVEQSLLTIGFQMLRIRERSRSFALARIMQPFLVFGLVFVLAYILQLALTGFLLALVSANLIVVIYMYMIQGIPLTAVRPDSQTLKKFFYFGLPLALVSIMNWVVALSDRYLIAVFHGSGAVGVYSVACSLPTRTIAVLYATLILAAYPRILSAWNSRGRDVTEDLVTKFVSIFLIIITPASLGFVLISDNLLHLLTPTTYHQGLGYIPWMVVSSFLLGFSMYINKSWELHKRTYQLLRISASAALLNFVLNLVVIPRFGAYGAAVTTTVAYLFYCAILWHQGNSLLRLRIDLTVLFRVLGASAVMAVAVIVLKQRTGASVGGTLFLVLVGTCTYLSIAYLLKLHKVLDYSMLD